MAAAPVRDGREALAFVRRHGIVLTAARGPLPSLAEAVAGAPIRGSWWAHPRARRIYLLLEAARASDRVLVCRLVQGKLTLVHRRLWPALVRLAPRLPKAGLAAVREEHTAGGRHRVLRTPFPAWVPEAVLRKGRGMSESAARSLLGPDLLRLLLPTARS